MDAKQREFIILRSDGLSYDKIAQKLKITKATGIQWSKLFEDGIKELQFHAMAELKLSYTFNIKSKYETLLKQLDKIDTAIFEADTAQTSIKDLFTIKQNLIYQLADIEKKVSVKSNVVTKNVLGENEDIPMRLNEV